MDDAVATAAATIRTPPRMGKETRAIKGMTTELTWLWFRKE